MLRSKEELVHSGAVNGLKVQCHYFVKSVFFPKFTRARKGHSILSPDRKEVVIKLKTLILAMHSMITDDLSIQLG